MSRAILWAFAVVGLAAAVALDMSSIEGARLLMGGGVASVGSHCGCVNWRSCTVPCSACCGPNGIDDCFKNPDPSVAPARSSSCCH